MTGREGTESPESATTALLREALRRAYAPSTELVAARLERMEPGYSGAELLRARVTARSPGCSATWRTDLVVKQIETGRGWLAWTSGDTCAREVQLWRSGILDRLPRGLQSAVLVAGQQVGEDHVVRGGTLVMRDMRRTLLRRPLRAPAESSPLLALVVDALAQLHATFWQDETLLDASLGLMLPEPALSFTAPDVLARRAAAGDTDLELLAMIKGWESFFASLPPPYANRLESATHHRARLANDVRELPFTLIHGDTWGPNIAARGLTSSGDARGVALLDWGLASAAPCTYDPLWLCATWPALSVARVMARYRARLALHLRSRGVRIAERTWLQLLDAGYLRTVLVGGEAFGRALAGARSPLARTRALAVAIWWARRAATAAERLGV